MDDVLALAQNLPSESVLMAMAVFLLTMLIKLPVKKATSRLSEEKRKSLNTLIVLIPAFLSFFASVLYYGIILKEWIARSIMELGFSVWLMSFLLYVTCERVLIVITGIKSGKRNTQSEEKLQKMSTQATNALKKLHPTDNESDGLSKAAGKNREINPKPGVK